MTYSPASIFGPRWRFLTCSRMILPFISAGCSQSPTTALRREFLQASPHFIWSDTTRDETTSGSCSTAPGRWASVRAKSMNDDQATATPVGKWGFGFVIPLLLAALGALSIIGRQSVVPFSSGYGRFALGGQIVAGSTAIIMGIGFICFAAFLFSSFFTPFRQRFPAGALLGQILGFLGVFLALGYSLFRVGFR